MSDFGFEDWMHRIGRLFDHKMGSFENELLIVKVN